MQLYYTTSAGYEEPQTDPFKSLGGFRSSNIVKNDDFDNLFGEITPYTIREDRDEYIALILRNTTGAEVTNTEIWVDTPTGAYSAFEIAVVTTTTDSEGNPAMERTRTRFTRPFTGNFSSSDTASRISIGTIANNQEFGIWVRRSLDITAINQDQEVIYERDPNNVNLYVPVVKAKQDIFTINLEWT